MVYVGVRRIFPGHIENDNSTAGFEWTAPEGDTRWLTETLDSTDDNAPDDPDLLFTARLHYRSIEE